MRTTVDILGCPVDALDMAGTLERCREAIASGVWLQHACVNGAKLVHMQRDPRLAGAIRECGLVTADGQAVVWAARLLGRRLPARVTGIDLMERLLGLAEVEGYRVFVLGARREALVLAMEKIRHRYPRLQIAGYRDGYFVEEQEEAVCEQIRQAKPQILFVAMSSPQKEVWLSKYGPSLGIPFAMGVGGSIDVIAGVFARAPRWMQAAGLEWLFRALQEPRRLGPRYLVTNTQFIQLITREWLRRRAGGLLS